MSQSPVTKPAIAHSRHFILKAICLLAIFLFTSQVAIADAPLKSKLGLDITQAGLVADIQKRYRAEKRSIRQALNRESRKLRRAKSSNDATAIAELTPVVADLQYQMQTAMFAEDAEIRGVLNTEQRAKFESYIDQRNEMVGSSRDAKVL